MRASPNQTPMEIIVIRIRWRYITSFAYLIHSNKAVPLHLNCKSIKQRDLDWPGRTHLDGQISYKYYSACVSDPIRIRFPVLCACTMCPKVKGNAWIVGLLVHFGLVKHLYFLYNLRSTY